MSESLRLADGRVVVNGQVVHRPQREIVREVTRAHALRPASDPLRIAIALALYG